MKIENHIAMRWVVEKHSYELNTGMRFSDSEFLEELLEVWRWKYLKDSGLTEKDLNH